MKKVGDSDFINAHISSPSGSEGAGMQTVYFIGIRWHLLEDYLPIKFSVSVNPFSGADYS